uniref:Translationally-controlled tumor protein homolog n=1 Tax=Aceria tosichella TaxID=561515 RepID=A0A6G1SMS5_9ACAR
MLIFKDIITNDELFTDSNPVELIDDCLYEVKCTHVSRKHGDIVLDGANPSAEGEDGDAGGCDETTESGLDLVLNQKLQSTSFTKADYKNYLKTYTKSLQEKWKEMELTEEQLTEYKEGFMRAAKRVMPKLDDVEFYVGESCNPDGMVALLEYRDKPDGSGEEAIMMFFKHGLEREKV